jgi:integrase
VRRFYRPGSALKWLGHSSVGITLGVYAHVLPTDDAKLAGELQIMYA